MVFWRNEDAVSEVISIILLVAITVIIAAVIAMYVFGIPANITKTNVVAVTAQLETSGEISLMYQGGQDDQSLSSLKITAPDGSIWYTRSPDGLLVPSSASDPTGRPVLGEPMIPTTPAGGWPPGKKHIQVVGIFTNGPNQVVLDTFL